MRDKFGQWWIMFGKRRTEGQTTRIGKFFFFLLLFYLLLLYYTIPSEDNGYQRSLGCLAQVITFRLCHIYSTQCYTTMWPHHHHIDGRHHTTITLLMMSQTMRVALSGHLVSFLSYSLFTIILFTYNSLF